MVSRLGPHRVVMRKGHGDVGTCVIGGRFGGGLGDSSVCTGTALTLGPSSISLSITEFGGADPSDGAVGAVLPVSGLAGSQSLTDGASLGPVGLDGGNLGGISFGSLGFAYAAG